MNDIAIQADTAQRVLANQVKKGQCILFLGAGVHAPPPDDSVFTYPPEHRPLLGGTLAKELASECRYEQDFPDEPVWDLQRVSLCFETNEALGRAALINFLESRLVKGRKPSSALKMLASLPFKIIVTTNYDRLFELALLQLGKDPSVLAYDQDSRNPTPDPSEDPTDDRPLLFKMHGGLDLKQRDSIVITDEDYITFVQRMSDKDPFHPIPQTIRYRMSRWSILFLGYSLRDYNLRLLFRTLRLRIDSANFPVSFSVDRKPDPLIVKVWQNNRRFITFVHQDIWSFVPWLYQEVMGREYVDA